MGVCVAASVVEPRGQHSSGARSVEGLFSDFAIDGYSSLMASFISATSLLLFLLFAALPLRAQAPVSSGNVTAASSAALSFPNNEQLRHFKTMSDPRLAADGKHILIRITDATADGAKSHLWITGIDGEDPGSSPTRPMPINAASTQANGCPMDKASCFWLNAANIRRSIVCR